MRTGRRLILLLSGVTSLQSGIACVSAFRGKVLLLAVAFINAAGLLVWSSGISGVNEALFKGVGCLIIATLFLVFGVGPFLGGRMLHLLIKESRQGDLNIYDFVPLMLAGIVLAVVSLAHLM